MKIKFSLPVQIIIGMGCGLILGPILGKDAIVLGEIGKVMIQLIKAIAAPLLFFAILDALIKAHISGSQAFKLFGVVLINASFALAIGLTITNLIEPGKYFQLSHFQQSAKSFITLDKEISFAKILQGMLPTNVFQPFIDNSIIAVVLLALIIGLAMKKIIKNPSLVEGIQPAGIEQFVSIFYKIFEITLFYILKLLPFAVMGAIARTTGEYGFEPLKGLLAYLLVGLLGLGMQILIVYQAWILIKGHFSLKTFWQAAKEPVIFAFGSNSSLATLPLTLKALEEKLGVSKAASRLGACIGTNLNNDGILLYEAMAVFFITQVYGIELSITQQIIMALGCVLAAVGIAGVPEAGVISLSIVLGIIGLPNEIIGEIIPILLSVDWLLARMRSVTNVLSDMVVSIAIE